MEYEFIREIFNQCSGNQMRDVFVEEITTDDPDEYVARYLVGRSIQFHPVRARSVKSDSLAGGRGNIGLIVSDHLAADIINPAVIDEGNIGGICKRALPVKHSLPPPLL